MIFFATQKRFLAQLIPEKIITGCLNRFMCLKKSIEQQNKIHSTSLKWKIQSRAASPCCKKSWLFIALSELSKYQSYGKVSLICLVSAFSSDKDMEI